MDDRSIRSVFQGDEAARQVDPGQEPSEADLSAEDLEKIRQARDLMQILIKTFKAFRIYLENNELLLKFQAQLQESFDAFLGQYDALEMRIRAASITLMGQPIYRSQDQNDNLAQKLYRDGFRRMTFHAGLDGEETKSFLEILKKSMSSTIEHDYDLVTLFWEKDFNFITYHAVEELLPEGVDPAEIEALTDSQVERIANQNVFQDHEMPFVDPLFGGGEDKRQDIYDNHAPNEESLMKTQLARSFLALELTEIQEIQKQIKNEQLENLFLHMADVILEIIYVERSFDDFKMMVESLEQVLVMYINFLDLDRATQILKKLHFLTEGYRQTSSKAAEFIDSIIERLGSVDRLQTLFQAFGQGSGISPASFGNFLVHLGSSSIPLICEKLTETTEREVRKNLCDVLVLLGSRYFDKLVEHLGEQKERDLRNKVYILTKIEDPRVVNQLKKLIQHPHAPIRQMVISSFSNYYNVTTRGLLFNALDDDDLNVRLSVLRLLSHVKDSAALESILNLVRHAQFHSKSMEEKQTFFTALAHLGGEDLVDSLGSILTRQNLKDKDKDNELRVCAAEALGLIGTPEALAQLKMGLKSRRKSVMIVCEEKIQTIESKQV